MEEKNVTNISLSTFFLILAIIAIIVMGIFIYKLNNDKTTEIQKSTELQSQVNSLNGTVSDLQGKINNISETINSNNSSESSNTINNNNSTENTTVKFSEKEIKDVLQMCLNLESAKTNGPGTILETLGLYKDYSNSNSEKSAKKTRFMKTSIKFSDFKEAMLKYMTEECYQKQWSDLYENEDGYLCYANVGATGVAYKVNSIKKVENGYTANVTASSEGPDSELTVKFNIDSNKCIVKSYEF
ncbi:MAG: hypothetical protein IKM97_05820 [Clostridia bacterium]|nr:hypothetical protein [Clostridia bacterium]